MTTVLRRSFILGRLSPNTGRARIGLRIKALLPCVSSWRISIVNSEGPRADPASNFREFCAAEADRRHSMHNSPDRCRSITLNGTPKDGTMRHPVGRGGSGSRGGAPATRSLVAVVAQLRGNALTQILLEPARITDFVFF